MKRGNPKGSALLRRLAAFAGIGAAFLLCTFVVAACPIEAAYAQTSSISDLIGSHEGTAPLPPGGDYVAGDDLRFTIDHENGETLLRFDGDDEIFDLTVERAPLGGRILKYDTGEVALQVTGWAGVTVYTKSAPAGLPADRVGDAHPLIPKIPNLDEMRMFAAAWAHRLQQNLALAVRFDADWEKQIAGDAERRLVADAMLNTERAFERIRDQLSPRNASAMKVDAVRIGGARNAGATAKSGTLTVMIADGKGVAGRPSSLAIERALYSRR